MAAKQPVAVQTRTWRLPCPHAVEVIEEGDGAGELGTRHVKLAGQLADAPGVQRLAVASGPLEPGDHRARRHAGTPLKPLGGLGPRPCSRRELHDRIVASAGADGIRALPAVPGAFPAASRPSGSQRGLSLGEDPAVTQLEHLVEALEAVEGRDIERLGPFFVGRRAGDTISGYY